MSPPTTSDVAARLRQIDGHGGAPAQAGHRRRVSTDDLLRWVNTGDVDGQPQKQI
ncbi:MAG: hypothetical protein JNM56_33095, partial [Planctomycetia bacterium]|nr:hypothetical protein [Planctomycetia bacterium]